MNKLKVYKFIIYIYIYIYITPSLHTVCRVGASRFSGIRVSRIRFGPANRIGLEKGRYISCQISLNSEMIGISCFSRHRVLGDTWGRAIWHNQGIPHGTMGEGHMA